MVLACGARFSSLPSKLGTSLLPGSSSVNLALLDSSAQDFSVRKRSTVNHARNTCCSYLEKFGPPTKHMIWQHNQSERRRWSMSHRCTDLCKS